MKAVSKFSLWIITALMLASVAPSRAQVAVYDFYKSTIVQQVFQLTDGNDFVLNLNDFVTPLSHYQGFPTTDYDNGVYFNLPLPFTFVFNGLPYNNVNIAVNGWINFGSVPLDTRDPQLLFNANLPNATIAPFFGDHYMRPDATQGFRPSRISWAVEGSPGSRIFTVQWEDLNVNYLTAQDPKQSTATFQLKLYEASTLQQPGRGNIEFHYGSVGSGLVQTSGATCGIEDENGLSFMNGLFTTDSDPLDSNRHSFRRTLTWPPSRLPGRAIQFTPFGYIVDHWGDGDVDLTQLTNVAAGFPIVSTGDALLILRARAWNVPLDSVFGRSAFHADVNHNGRYTIDLQGQRHNDTTRVAGSPAIGHPNDVVYFEATAFDAAYIMLYLAGKLPTLPWILDTIPPFGKLPGNVPVAVNFAQPTENNAHFAVIPVTVQGVGAVGAEFNLTTGQGLRLISIKQAAGDVSVVSNGNHVVLAGAVSYTTPQVVAYAQFEKITDGTGATVATEGLVVNDRLTKNVTATVGAPVSTGLLSAYPDPFATKDGGTQISYNTLTDGSVTLKVYDVLGNCVRTLASVSEQSHGSYSVTFDGRDSFNKELPSGTYFCRLNADGASTTRQIVLYSGVR